MSINKKLQFVIPTTVVDNNGISNYNYPKFKIKNIENKGLGVVATEDLTSQDINKVLIYGGVLLTDKQYKKFIKINNDLNFENNSSNSIISYITKANDLYLNADPVLYNDDTKMGWIGSYVNEVSEISNSVYNAELIVLSPEDLKEYQLQINKLPDCINKTQIVGISIKYIVKKEQEITAYYGESFIRNNYKQKQPQITYNEDGSSLVINDNVNSLTPKK